MSHFSDVKNSFLKFYSDSERKHAVIPGVSLVALNDPTLLFVNSGMFPLVPYLSGQPHPMGKRITNVQRSIRTDPDDFEEIGDTRHTTVFNMMGNWSLGDYFKKEQIPWVLKLYVEVFKLDPYKIFVSVFEGNDAAPKDEESISLWKEAFKKYGIDAEYSSDPTNVRSNFGEDGEIRKPEKENSGELFKQVKIFSYPEKKNWWKRGYAPGELGGPDSEMFFDLGKKAEVYEEGDKIHINSDNGRFLEVGNSVFMQYKLDENLKWKELSQKNVDFGGGLERVMLCQLNMQNGTSDVFEIEVLRKIIDKLEEISGKSYKDEKDKNSDLVKSFRVVADHIRAATLLMGDGVIPSNKEHGYVLRRFIRRAIRFGMNLGIHTNFTKILSEHIISEFGTDEPQILENKEQILREIEREENKFRVTLENGVKEFKKISENVSSFSGKEAFYLFESFGFPLEMTLEELRLDTSQKENVVKEFEELKKSHQDLSRSGAEKKFKGGLADTSETTTALHTSHHLLLAALQKVVSKDIHQRGSNITSERLRIDFNNESKLLPEQLKEIETQVNQWINEGFKVERLELPKDEAEKMGAEHEFGAKYGDTVSVYVITTNSGEVISKEFCGGPHVNSSEEISKLGNFKILKEESSSAGVRRIKATLV